MAWLINPIKASEKFLSEQVTLLENGYQKIMLKVLHGKPSPH
jgi:hypothetical protein